MLLILPGAAFLLLDETDMGGGLAPVKEVPELWSEPITQCPYEGAQALAFAAERMAVADAKRERRPFHVQDGVQAVPVYEVAAACFRKGGDGGPAKLADDAAAFMRRDVTDEFRTRRVRLDHALSTEDHITAQKEVRVLLQFVEGKQHDWVTWLQNLDRNLKLKIGSQRRK
jgi:hypothetical protein